MSRQTNQDPLFQTPASPRSAGSDGFALVEVVLALVLIALLVALSLPGLVRATGPAAVRLAAFQVSALLRDDRNAALSSGRASAAVVEGNGERVRSQTSSTFVGMPAGATAILSADASTIRFFANGRSSGGNIVIASPSSRFTIDVSSDTGAIHVASP